VILSKGDENMNLCFQIHHVAVQTANFEKAFKFYTETLGLKIQKEPFQFKGRTLTWLDGGGIKIELFSIKAGKEPQKYDARRVGTDHIALEVKRLDDAISYLSERGVTILKEPFYPPTADPFQPRVAFIEGADGEEIELRETV
jgi:glyoxylase I family protein